MPLRPAEDGRERGQVLPLVAVGVVVAGLLALGLARVGAGAVASARARTAADAAALAGVAAGEVEAHRLARLNGGRLVSFSAAAGVVEVEVVVDGAAARARARARPIEPRGSAPPATGKEPHDVHGHRFPDAPAPTGGAPAGGERAGADGE